MRLKKLFLAFPLLLTLNSCGWVWDDTGLPEEIKQEETVLATTDPVAQIPEVNAISSVEPFTVPVPSGSVTQTPQPQVPETTNLPQVPTVEPTTPTTTPVVPVVPTTPTTPVVPNEPTITGSNNSTKQPYQESLVSPGEDWEIDFDNKIGASTRIKATEQRPFVFCFATAAAMLWDQKRCWIDEVQCNNQPQSSFLSAVPAGQNFRLGKEIDLRAGGSALLSLNFIVEHGSILLENCNYGYLDPNKIDYIDNFFRVSKTAKVSWEKYKDCPHLEAFYRKQFVKAIQDFNPSITESQAEILLTLSLSETELWSSLLINSNCWDFKIRDDRFSVKFKKVENRSDIKTAFNTIDNLLKERKPVIVNFCTKVYKNEPCKMENSHAAVIIARATANNTITGDKKSVYWIVNSWGEGWQKENRDGWVFSENLLNGVYGEIIWLETK